LRIREYEEIFVKDSYFVLSSCLEDKRRNLAYLGKSIRSGGKEGGY